MKHLEEVGQGYWSHLARAWMLAVQVVVLLVILPPVLIVHGMAPGLWTNVASDRLAAARRVIDAGRNRA